MCDINSRSIIIREQYANIFMYKKPMIFLPAGINLFRVIKSKVEHCINPFISTLNKLCWPGWELNKI